jgi:hypothetical protein
MQAPRNAWSRTTEHHFAASNDPDAGEHRLADSATGTTKALRRLRQSVGHRQQIAEDERIERDKGCIRLAEARLVD